VTRPSARAAAKSSNALSKSPGGKSDAYHDASVTNKDKGSERRKIQRRRKRYRKGTLGYSTIMIMCVSLEVRLTFMKQFAMAPFNSRRREFRSFLPISGLDGVELILI
jgi:hypothetical protein